MNRFAPTFVSLKRSHTLSPGGIAKKGKRQPTPVTLLLIVLAGDYGESEEDYLSRVVASLIRLNVFICIRCGGGGL